MKIKTAELEGAALDYCVALSVGLVGPIEGVYLMPSCSPDEPGGLKLAPVWIDTEKTYSPSTDWAQGGPLIDKYNIGVEVSVSGWGTFFYIAEVCFKPQIKHLQGKTYLISAMRAIVAAELGPEVDVPEELV